MNPSSESNPSIKGSNINNDRLKGNSKKLMSFSSLQGYLPWITVSSVFCSLIYFDILTLIINLLIFFVILYTRIPTHLDYKTNTIFYETENMNILKMIILYTTVGLGGVASIILAFYNPIPYGVLLALEVSIRSIFYILLIIMVIINFIIFLVSYLLIMIFGSVGVTLVYILYALLMIGLVYLAFYAFLYVGIIGVIIVLSGFTLYAVYMIFMTNVSSIFGIPFLSFPILLMITRIIIEIGKTIMISYNAIKRPNNSGAIDLNEISRMRLKVWVDSIDKVSFTMTSSMLVIGVLSLFSLLTYWITPSFFIFDNKITLTNFLFFNLSIKINLPLPTLLAIYTTILLTLGFSILMTHMETQSTLELYSNKNHLLFVNITRANSLSSLEKSDAFKKCKEVFTNYSNIELDPMGYPLVNQISIIPSKLVYFSKFHTVKWSKERALSIVSWIILILLVSVTIIATTEVFPEIAKDYTNPWKDLFHALIEKNWKRSAILLLLIILFLIGSGLILAFLGGLSLTISFIAYKFSIDAIHSFPLFLTSYTYDVPLLTDKAFVTYSLNYQEPDNNKKKNSYKIKKDKRTQENTIKTKILEYLNMIKRSIGLFPPLQESIFINSSNTSKWEVNAYSRRFLNDMKCKRVLEEPRRFKGLFISSVFILIIYSLLLPVLAPVFLNFNFEDTGRIPIPFSSLMDNGSLGFYYFLTLGAVFFFTIFGFLYFILTVGYFVLSPTLVVKQLDTIAIPCIDKEICEEFVKEKPVLQPSFSKEEPRDTQLSPRSNEDHGAEEK